MANEPTNPLAALTPAQLHAEGLDWLVKARQRYNADPTAAGAAAVGVGHFLASLSARDAGTDPGAHRAEPGGPREEDPEAERAAADERWERSLGEPPPYGPGANEFTGHHS